MTVYLDLVMGLNFAVDLLLLTGTNRLAGYPPGYPRAAAAAAIGGLYGGVCLLPGFQFLAELLWRGVSLGLMSITAFGIGPGTLRRTGLFLMLSMALGGSVLALGNGGIFGLLVAATGLFALCAITAGSGNPRKLVPVSLTRDGITVKLTALHDTGNTLRDPLTGEGILVTGSDVARELLGLNRRDLEDPVSTMARLGLPGLRLIPYRVVGQDRGMLLGLRIPQATIRSKTTGLTVAFAPSGLGNDGEEFNALIGGNI